MQFHSGKEIPAAPKPVHLSVYIEVCGSNFLLFLFCLFYCKCILPPSKKIHPKLKFVLL